MREVVGQTLLVEQVCWSNAYQINIRVFAISYHLPAQRRRSTLFTAVSGEVDVACAELCCAPSRQPARNTNAPNTFMASFFDTSEFCDPLRCQVLLRTVSYGLKTPARRRAGRCEGCRCRSKD